MQIQPPLPPEILEHIFSYLPPSCQSTFHTAALVSRSWYLAATIFLYRGPIVTGKNFDCFVRSVCPSINAHVRQNGLADFIRRLDMSGLVHNGSKSLTARLLGRVKNNLDEFIAPQASFSVNSLAAISKCGHLRCLDLGFVSEAITMSDLLRSIKALEKLTRLHLPRASSYAVNKDGRSDLYRAWPPNLRELHLNGGFNWSNLNVLWTFPTSVSHLWIEHCPHRRDDLLIKRFFEFKGSQLTYLSISFPPKRTLNSAVVASIARSCESLLHLNINIEMLEDMWEDELSIVNEPSLPTVECLEIGCLEEHSDEFLIWTLIKMSGFLFSEKVPKLRRLLIHRKLKWTGSEARARNVAEMNELLKALAREDGEVARVSENEAGVVLFGQR